MTDQRGTYWNRMVPELTVTDVSASLHFYLDVLDFNLMIRRHEPEFAYICYGEAQLMLEQHHTEGWNTAELIRPLGRGVNFQIEVDDVSPVLTRLSTNGVSLFRPLRDNNYCIGNSTACHREFLVQDPDGYLLRFCQYIE